MPKSFPSNDDRQRRHRAATSNGCKRDAERRRCPNCGRKSAMKTTTDGDFWQAVCRWCGFSKGGFADGPTCRSE